MNRKKSREVAMKILYQMTINEGGYEEAIKNYFENSEYNIKNIDVEYIKYIVKGVTDNICELDEKIESKLINWKINRISKINLSILRLALYEMFYCDDIPRRVSVNEAIELAKKYSDDSSPKFINGILGNFVVD
ncbi:hypothetical protein CLTEP_00870 [Clostridium tepidiprofundi DSM 19306]|uniref:Transcription antitermination protein NusB n=1 Tax=Clostridium tepidiprofundi DSM 19306 TaxID=1121338 RepID=A0A151B726_9CLOT|nr:transcription antitermination factor NusB [Clostridium tepidiprofundi]KYH35694.1 hypothetical protein CLTEP_00870 [Clostridium tepidiprofundi DSM 19306]